MHTHTHTHTHRKRKKILPSSGKEGFLAMVDGDGGFK